MMRRLRQPATDLPFSAEATNPLFVQAACVCTELVAHKTGLLPYRIEVTSDDDVGRAHDRGLEAGAALSMDLGKHPNDRMLSFYMKTPSGFDVEIGAGGVKVDDATWRVRTYDHASLWGHKRPAPR